MRKCPYCGNKIMYRQLLKCRDKEYVICNTCEKRSKMLFLTNVRNNAIFAIASSLIILLIFIIMNNIRVWIILLVSLPFVLFYLTVPFFVFLSEMKQEPRKMKKPKQEDLYLSSDYYDENTEHTLQYNISSFMPETDCSEDTFSVDADMGATRRINDIFIDDEDYDI